MVLRASSGIWVLGFGLELLLIHKLMTTSGSIFLAGASRGVGHQIARILATQNLPVLALIRSPAAQSDLQALNVETVVGDALNPTDVTNAMNGQISAIVSTIGGLPQDGQRADFGSPAYMVISVAYLNNWSVRVACRRHNGNYLNKQANSFSFIRSKFLNP